MDDFIDESMIEMYTYEVSEMLDKIETILIESDREGCLTSENIQVLFRLMHTLKSSSRAMGYKVSSNLAHSVEDLLKHVDNSNVGVDDFSIISDIALSCVDYFKLHIHKIKSHEEGEDDASYLFEKIDSYFESLTIAEKEKSVLETGTIQENNEVNNTSNDTDFIQSKEKTIEEVNNTKLESNNLDNKNLQDKLNSNNQVQVYKNNIEDPIISVRMDKLDSLMNLVGEIVIAEPLVTECKRIEDFNSNQFQRDATHLHKMINELQSIVMSIRMVTFSSTMLKMNRIIHDMNKKFNKTVELIVVGEDTEVDKNVIDLISDPLMHIIRNAIDHGIETKEEREKLGKSPNGKIVLEAKNIGSNILISITDDGCGIDTLAIYNKALSLGLIEKSYESMSERELFNILMIPGFSTNSTVSEYSGRGVGMDIVQKNVQRLGGTIHIYSKKNEGTTVALKIPLLLSIIEAMNIRINKTLLTIPLVNVVETFRISKKQIVNGAKDDRLIKVRDQLYPLVSLNKVFNLETKEVDMDRGIIMVLETEGDFFCIYVDEIIGQYPVVAKAIPDYLKKYKEIDGISGCTIMRDGHISLILDCYAIIRIVVNKNRGF